MKITKNVEIKFEEKPKKLCVYYVNEFTGKAQLKIKDHFISFNQCPFTSKKYQLKILILKITFT